MDNHEFDADLEKLQRDLMGIIALYQRFQRMRCARKIGGKPEIIPLSDRLRILQARMKST